LIEMRSNGTGVEEEGSKGEDVGRSHVVDWGEEVSVEVEDEDRYAGGGDDDEALDFGSREGVMRSAGEGTTPQLAWRGALSKAAVSGVGFLSDAYDLYAIPCSSVRVRCVRCVRCACSLSLTHTHACARNGRFVINIVLLILSVTHGISAADKGWISSAVLVGALFGQIGFGLIADKVSLSPAVFFIVMFMFMYMLLSGRSLTVRAHHGSCADDDGDGQIGRKKGFVATLSLVILGTLASAVAYPVGPVSIAAVLAVLRFVLGIGIGGEYPLSATITGSLLTPLSSSSSARLASARTRTDTHTHARTRHS
jgi:hypothetical protein